MDAGPCPHSVGEAKNQRCRAACSVFFINSKLSIKDPAALKLLPVKIKQRLIFQHPAHTGRQNAVAQMERNRWKEEPVPPLAPTRGVSRESRGMLASGN